jgi:protein-S-isoprenylcysteine O-methyltransferase Ste14
MTTYERVFGAGPRGLVLSIALFALAWKLETAIGLPSITHSILARWIVFLLSVMGSVVLALWSVKSLPPDARGKTLITSGIYRYLRHPIYATFLSCFDFGLAVLLNNWIYILWAILLHGIWHWNILGEEKLMRQVFPEEYDDYCGMTGRFIPKIIYFRHNK